MKDLRYHTEVMDAWINVLNETCLYFSKLAAAETDQEKEQEIWKYQDDIAEVIYDIMYAKRLVARPKKTKQKEVK